MKSFETYLRLLIDLHRAMVEEDESKADEIRDEMDGPWRQLSEKEKTILNQVSVAMYGDYEKVPGTSE